LRTAFFLVNSSHGLAHNKVVTVVWLLDGYLKTKHNEYLNI